VRTRNSRRRQKLASQSYPGATDTSRELLNYWFYTDHRLADGPLFRYHSAQQQAIETLIYLYEVVKIRRHRDLLQQFAAKKDLRLLQHDEFSRYCIKMATGSGKTKVMSLAIVWQYFNAVRENNPDYAKTFLILAPNIIVFERLHNDFAGGHIFQTDPLFPKHFELFWQMDY
jgi:type III restriction enzyme